MALKVDPQIRTVLEAIGLPYEIRDGTRHKKVYVCGQLAAVLSRRPAQGRSSVKWTINNIRRTADAIRNDRAAPVNASPHKVLADG
jgi:hypothetical protein